MYAIISRQVSQWARIILSLKCGTVRPTDTWGRDGPAP